MCRQASAQDKVEITPEMEKMGAHELDRYIGSDARHLYSSEEIVNRVYRAMAAAQHFG